MFWHFPVDELMNKSNKCFHVCSFEGSSDEQPNMVSAGKESEELET
jgi:hypothetical protein